MVNPIYSKRVYTAAGAAVHGRKGDAVELVAPEQRYDQVQFSSHIDERERRVKETVSHISQDIRRRPTQQDIETLRSQVTSGAYQPNPHEIAARMLLMKEES